MDKRAARPMKTPAARIAWRLAPLAVLAAAAVALLASGVLHQLSLSGLEAHRAAWQAAAARHPGLAFAEFVGAYVVLTGVGLPVAAVLTLTAGVLFGALVGGLAAVAGSTGAALITYAAARSSLGPWLRDHLARTPRLARLVDSLRARGFWVILSARLMPIMPFPLVNLACGLAEVPFATYATATLAGALPASLIYAAVGAGLAETLTAGRLEQAIRAPTVWGPLLALAVLALLPVLLRGRFAASERA